MQNLRAGIVSCGELIKSLERVHDTTITVLQHKSRKEKNENDPHPKPAEQALRHGANFGNEVPIREPARRELSRVKSNEGKKRHPHRSSHSHGSLQTH